MGKFLLKENVLKNADIVNVCSMGNKGTKLITTDRDGLSITKERSTHTCNSEMSDQKTEAHQSHAHVRKQWGDIFRKPITVVQSELQEINKVYFIALWYWKPCTIFIQGASWKHACIA